MNFTDPLTEVIVDGPLTYTVQDYVHNVLQDEQEKSFYMCDGSSFVNQLVVLLSLCFLSYRFDSSFAFRFD